MYPEKSQLRVHNSSPQPLRGGGSRALQWKHPDHGGFSNLDFPQGKSVCTLLLEKFTLGLLTTPGIITDCLSSDDGYFQLYFASWNEWLIKFFSSEFYMIIYTK